MVLEATGRLAHQLADGAAAESSAALVAPKEAAESVHLPVVLHAFRPREELGTQAQPPSAQVHLAATCLAHTQEVRDQAITAQDTTTPVKAMAKAMVTASAGDTIPTGDRLAMATAAATATVVATAVCSQLVSARAATALSAVQALAAFLDNLWSAKCRLL